MLDLAKRFINLGVGALSLTGEKAEKLVGELVKQGQVGSEEAKDLVEQLVARGQEERQALKDNIKEEVSSVVGSLTLASKKDVEELKERIAALEAKLEQKEL